MTFSLHPQLKADCHQLGTLKLCTVLLHQNAAVPWFILVPHTDCTELLELSESDQVQAMSECSRVGAVIKKRWSSPKLNFGAIGNMVPQLHLHVIGRSPDDPCWPNPVWGNLQVDGTYSDAELSSISDELFRQ